MAINQNGRPVPLPDDASAPFFDGARRGELRYGETMGGLLAQ